MNATKAYYSLVQYCPDIARIEAVNVGVVLFCPQQRFLEAKLMKSNNRIRRFFGEEADNYEHLNAMKDALVKRLEVERVEFAQLEDLQQFVQTRANKVILTEPKPVKVVDPRQDLETLFKELVEEPEGHLIIHAALPLRKRLDDLLLDQTVKPFVQTNVKVQIPAMRETLTVPYGYQNGRFNLIQPVEFNQKSESRIKNAACIWAVEGLSLYKHPDSRFGSMQLVVVADFVNASQDAVGTVRGIFAESEVRMFTLDALDELKRDILSHGKPVSNS